jgi:iron complex outermembrane receptor protein
LSPRIGINYVMTPRHSFRLTASQATRTPSLGENHADYRAVADVGGTILTPRLFVGPENLESERIRSIEIGYLYESQEPRISFDVKLFRDLLQDLISPDDIEIGNPSPESLLVENYAVFANVADARIHGAEATFDYHPDALFHLYLSHAAIVIRGDNRISGIDTARDSTPRHTTAAMLSSRFFRTVEGSLMYYRVGEFDGLGSGEPVPMHRRLDARLAFSLNAFQVDGTIALIGQNLLDDYLEWRDDNAFERRYFLSLSLQLD